VALRAEGADVNKTLEWIHAAEQPTGGIAAWQMPDGSYHSSYLEVSGYLLPTLIKWDAGPLALRVSDWLLHSQNADGSFNGLDGVPRPFDTAAVVEGLETVYQATGTAIYRAGANKAGDWMRSQIQAEGFLPDSPGTPAPRIYNLRASAIINNQAELEYWQINGGLIRGQQRTHYLAYALEGLLNFGALETAQLYLELAYHSGALLQPFYVDDAWRPTVADYDICSSCQMAILFKRVGFDVSRHYQAIQEYIKPDGSVPQSNIDNRSLSWAAKFYLDLVYEMEHDAKPKKNRKKK
jgi:hypothetical protein